MIGLPNRMLHPSLWAKATKQPPKIQRLAARASRARALDPGGYSYHLRMRDLFNALGEHGLADAQDTYAALARRRARILSASRGTSHPIRKEPDPMASSWTINNRKFSTRLVKGRITVIEEPFKPADLATTHTLYVNTNGALLFLSGPITPFWPDAKPITAPSTPSQQSS